MAVVWRQQVIDDPSACARDLWRRARRNGWHLLILRVGLGWRSPSQEHARRLREAIRREPGYTLAPPEDYEPENDPLETIVDCEWRRLSASDFEEQVLRGVTFGKAFDAVMTRIGLERER